MANKYYDPENNVWVTIPGVAAQVVASSDATAAQKAMADYVCDGTADDVEIIAALAAITTGDVYLIGANFTINAQITIANKKGLYCTRGTVCKPSGAAVDPFLISAGGSLVGLNWDSSATANYAGEVVTLVGSDQWYFNGRNSILRDWAIYNRPNDLGTAVYFHADTADDYISKVVIDNLYIAGFDNGVYFHSEDLAAGLLTWINGNIITNLRIIECITPLRLNAELALAVAGQCNNNEFHFLIELDTITTNGIYIQGAAAQNRYYGTLSEGGNLGAGDYAIQVDNGNGVNNVFWINAGAYDIVANSKALFTANYCVLHQELEYNSPPRIYATNCPLYQRQILLGAGGWISTTAGAAAQTKVEYVTNDIDLQHFDFDGTTDEFIQFTGVLPLDYDGSTMTAKFHWTGAAGAGTVKWDIQGRAYADDDAIDAAWGTAATVTDTFIAAGDVHISAATGALTLAGTPTAGQLVQFRVGRDPDSDTKAEDARFIACALTYNIKG